VMTLIVLATAGVFEQQEIPEPAPPITTVIREVVEQTVIASTPDNQVSAIAQKAVPSIVSVNVGTLGADGQFFSLASGSGVVYSKDGYIVTNNHVVEAGGDVQVTFPDGKIYPATVEGTDPLTDLAVLKVGAPGVVPISVADLSGLSIGDLAVAVGNPLALRGGPSVTSGIVSALDRALEVDTGIQLFGLIQTDAPITRGSSGGALLNETGELIGITTAIGTSGIFAEGLGFAVPVNIVQQVADDLIRDGLVRHAFLGITGVPAFEATQEGASIPIGARIENLEEGSAMGDAGAVIGDIITELDGHEVETMDQLVALLRNYRADQVVTVTILRGEQPIDLAVTLDMRPEDL
ncbi:MAG TPA: trypsin-like peptidase domain-containing protein, partial [Acidimicrobiia bacterium]